MAPPPFGPIAIAIASNVWRSARLVEMPQRLVLAQHWPAFSLLRPVSGRC